MNSLKDLDYAFKMDVPEAAGEALKALALGAAGPDQQRTALDFIVREIACVDKLAFTAPGDAETMAWRNGRRFVGLQIENIIAEPMDGTVVALPPARTVTERQRRRGRGG